MQLNFQGQAAMELKMQKVDFKDSQDVSQCSPNANQISQFSRNRLSQSG